MTAKTIQEKLNDRADTKLHGELCNAFSAFRKAIKFSSRNIGYATITIRRRHTDDIKLKGSELLDALQTTIQELQQDNYRQVETNAFLAQINHLAVDVEEMKEIHKGPTDGSKQ